MKDEPRSPAAAPGGPAAGNGEKPITELADELLRLAQGEAGELSKRVAMLTVREQADLALRLPAGQRQELLLQAPKPMRVVRALPDADLYLTIREIGPTDAMALIALASNQQIQHLVDLESWRKDRFDADRCGAWVAYLLESGEPALKRFLRHTDDELLALLFKKWIRIEQIEYEDGADVHGHGETETGNAQGLVTPDGYYRFSPSITEHAAAIGRFLQMFYVGDPHRYQRIMWTAQWELPSDLEEQALKWRQSRLEEHGFPAYDEALAVYSPPEESGSRPTPPEPSDPDGLYASRSALPILSEHGQLAVAVDRLGGRERDRVLHEIASLANHLLVADNADTGDPRSHRAALQKAAGFIGIALDRRRVVTAAEVARNLARIPAVELFREGFAEVAELHRRAHTIVHSGWAANHPDAIQLLDAPLRERIQALLESRPQYFELASDLTTGQLREFKATTEIEETRAALEMAEVVGQLVVDHLGLDPALAFEPVGSDPPSPWQFSTIVLTLLAWHATSGRLCCDPLPGKIFTRFLKEVVCRLAADPAATGRAFDDLIASLSDSFNLDKRVMTILQAYGRFCLQRLDEECSGLDPREPIESRYITCLLLDL